MSTFSKRAREQKKAEKKRRKRRRRDEKRDMEPAEPEIVTQEDIVGQLRPAEEVLKELHDGPMGVASGASAAPIPSKLFVGRLSDSTTSDSLREHFESIAGIDEAIVIMDRDTGYSRNFGFVTVTDRKDAATVIEKLNDSELDGRNIVVRVATER